MIRTLADQKSRTLLTTKHRHLVALTALVLLALAVRLFLLIKADWMADYDESVIGLMAIDITRGSHPSMFYGQPYMGSLEAYLAAPLFALFGASRQLLKLIPLTMTVASVLTTYMLARRLAGDRAGVLASLIIALAPVYVLANTLKAGSGTTAEIIPLGNLALLAVVNAVDGASPRRSIWWACVGFALGLGLWLHGLIVYYAVAVAAYVLLRCPSILLRSKAWLAVPAFAAGAWPLLNYNLERGWPTFTYLFDTGKPKGDGVGPDAIIRDLLGNLVPRVLGVGIDSLHWLGWPAAAAAVLTLAAVVWHCLQARVRHGAEPAEIVALLALSIPLVYLLSGFGNAAINPFGIDSAGRYVVPLFAAVPLALGFVYKHLSRSAAVGVALLIGLNGVAGLASADGTLVLQSPYYNRAPASFAPLITALNEERIAHVWTEVGLGYPLMLQSNENILAADYLERMNKGPVRFPDAYKAVDQASRTAFVVAILPGQVGPLEQELRRRAIPYAKREVGRLALLVPERSIHPSIVAGAMGFQY